MNHSGVVTRCTTDRSVTCGSPRNHSPPSTTTQNPSSSRTGTTTRRTRPSSGAPDRAAANPPTKKNSPNVWSTHVTGTNPGMSRNGLSMLTPLTPATVAVTSQCPTTTPTTAMARTVSTTGSRPLTVGLLPPSGLPRPDPGRSARPAGRQPVPRHDHAGQHVREQFTPPAPLHRSSPVTIRTIRPRATPPTR